MKPFQLVPCAVLLLCGLVTRGGCKPLETSSERLVGEVKADITAVTGLLNGELTRNGLGEEGKDVDLDKMLSGENKGEAEENFQIPGFEKPLSTGVIWVMEQAALQGYNEKTAHEWANFGQGAPEVGELPNDLPDVELSQEKFKSMMDKSKSYAPVEGLVDMRSKIADMYNARYRKGKASQYSAENVMIASGGRTAMSRIAHVLNKDSRVAHFSPEYTAYKFMLSAKGVKDIFSILLKPEDNFGISNEDLNKILVEKKIETLVMSNPCNPTGQAFEGEKLEKLVQLSNFAKNQKGQQRTIVFDEFYSWYNMLGPLGESLSAAKYVEDVNKDAVVIINGLTKNMRRAGHRLSWVLGPPEAIAALKAVGSAMDGGASHLDQLIAYPEFDLKRLEKRRLALQTHFRDKREYVLNRLERMGLKVDVPPKWTFYSNLSHLPQPLNNGMGFFEECLKERVIVVPGKFFDIDPNGTRDPLKSETQHFARLSFGPEKDTLIKGLDGIQRVLLKHKVKLPTDGHVVNLAKDVDPLDSSSGFQKLTISK
ncbi:hypothetical protein CROQUDRAFT_673907 [Cronartium quercuum f. sp. fusiforme G11]|uniref:Aminotransferase class I/classII large domain-containing protein n=1 Tax=Cronartium quercuum f. sp. fusiforme G11 TaxID=708437 RepID=A0A9P6NDN1_9BASI|nr:hypothetical protein CROQUDRAFT_673907 [Cronartium quercuum f. sp. fusiforme G11]